MAYTISPLHSRESERKLRPNIPGNDEFKRDKSRQYRDVYKKPLHKATEQRSQVIVTCENCGATLKYYSLSNHRKSRKCKEHFN